MLAHPENEVKSSYVGSDTFGKSSQGFLKLLPTLANLFGNVPTSLMMPKDEAFGLGLSFPKYRLWYPATEGTAALASRGLSSTLSWRLTG